MATPQKQRAQKRFNSRVGPCLACLIFFHLVPLSGSRTSSPGIDRPMVKPDGVRGMRVQSSNNQGFGHEKFVNLFAKICFQVGIICAWLKKKKQELMLLIDVTCVNSHLGVLYARPPLFTFHSQALHSYHSTIQHMNSTSENPEKYSVYHSPGQRLFLP